ncbi:SDR family NAD(P)-dependent oxidoreductase [Anaerotruncus sp. 1XD42-93]|uniref:SDR family NAD(P)-dependent oxidoreductase n=1 Tax=Anaerotruncus sp. 1XD42-93 TaxID=2320853 RepID=UPI001A9BDE5D|nr:SDR family NAD(P)-dependent oxidoreductase [Anaerotruncus sp. 1XD42-93]
MEGKKAVITGSASGFGKETALLFAREGAEISLLDINAESAQKVATEIAKIGGRAHVMQVDVSEEESVKSAFSQALEQMHTVDILINCAGYGRSSRIQDLTLEQWRRLIDVNMTGTFLCCREIIPHMVERQCGKIVNLASICAQTGRMVAVDYAGSKSGIVGITRALALQVAADGINVNAIAPGPVVTPLFEKNYTTEQMNSLLSTIPFKRKGTPTDIANLLLFLSSDESGWITGEVIAINGGAFIG